ncbi:Pimeloyl-ACP methyl ester carboxylesterase [Filimonas lacunae]|uniref:Pimeloyl-ACP methyl ester carboxylesterase n=1 Tax=Filimonas lacunae TaxID=477680 RepID=A0A1N7RHK7_9BACT|nr:Pimeloyl-ACP methyl ester carboxylesterase [Filimonas lacunae]
MLHGAIGASCQLKTIAGLLASDYDVHLLNFPGHGGEAFPEEAFSIPLFSTSVHHYIQKHQLKHPVIFGYSMGGYVAMHLAKQHPQLIRKIITLGTKFHWDETIANRETKMLNPETIAAKVPVFAAGLEAIHAPNNWREVLQRTTDMLLAMGQSNPLQPEDYKTIQTPVLIMLGDRDKMVTLEETVNTYKNLPNAHLAVLPDTPHPIEQVNAEMINWFIRQ